MSNGSFPTLVVVLKGSVQSTDQLTSKSILGLAQKLCNVLNINAELHFADQEALGTYFCASQNFSLLVMTSPQAEFCLTLQVISHEAKSSHLESLIKEYLGVEKSVCLHLAKVDLTELVEKTSLLVPSIDSFPLDLEVVVDPTSY